MRRSRILRPSLSVAVLGLCTGCVSLPPALLIASQAVDGVSYLTTGKSGTDHLLSAALDEDCALHRVISGVAVCQAEEEEQVAEAPRAVAGAGLGADTFFAPHGGGGDTAHAAVAEKPSDVAVREDANGQRFFVVLGSFADRDNARRAADSAGGGVRVRAAEVAGHTYYRVVAGPFDLGATAVARRTYAETGYRGAWSAPACARIAAEDCIADD